MKPVSEPTPLTKEQTIDKLLDAVMVAYDENTPNEALRPVFEEHLSQAILQERNSWINQKANDHDERIREAERNRIVEIITNFYDGLIDYSRKDFYNSLTTGEQRKYVTQKALEYSGMKEEILKALENKGKDE